MFDDSNADAKRAGRAANPEDGRTDGAQAPDSRLELNTFLVNEPDTPLLFDESPKDYRATIHDYGDGLCETSYRLIPDSWKNRWGAGNYQQSIRGKSDNREINEENAVRRAKSKVRKLAITLRADHLLTLSFRDRIDDLGEAWKLLEKFVRRIHTQYPNWAYVAVPELQKRGAWHFHLAMRGFQDVGFIRSAWWGMYVVVEDRAILTSPIRKNSAAVETQTRPRYGLPAISRST